RMMYSRNFMAFMPELRYINYMESGDMKKQIRLDNASGRLNTFQKSLLQPREPEFLFDLENDPWEMNNLVKDPAYQSVLQKMRKFMETEMIGRRDVMMLPEYELLQISQSRNLYEFRQQDADFPVRKIYNA